MNIQIEDEDLGYLIAHLSAQIEGLDEELLHMREKEWNPDRVAMQDARERLDKIRSILLW